MIDPAERLIAVCNAVEDAANKIIGRLSVEISPIWVGVSVHVVDNGEDHPNTSMAMAIKKIYSLFPDVDWSGDPLTGVVASMVGA